MSANDPIVRVEVKTNGDYGIVDVQFFTKKSGSGWLAKSPDSGKVFSTERPGDGFFVGLVGRKWAKHGLMDLQLAYKRPRPSPRCRDRQGATPKVR
jgi:hypothetical protein